MMIETEDCDIMREGFFLWLNVHKMEYSNFHNYAPYPHFYQKHCGDVYRCKTTQVVQI